VRLSVALARLCPSPNNQSLLTGSYRLPLMARDVVWFGKSTFINVDLLLCGLLSGVVAQNASTHAMLTAGS
jgi:hypothetical protein